MDKYLELYNSMVDGKSYTAKELGVHPATMTAMVNRGLVVVVGSGSPKHYAKAERSLYAKLSDLANEYGSTYFGLYKTGKKTGMLCRIMGGKILDCNDKPYNTDDVVIARFNQNYIDLNSGKIVYVGASLADMPDFLEQE